MDKIFKAMADKNRRKILTLLKDKGQLGVSQLLKSFDISQGTLSTHLSILRKAGLVSCRVAGRQRIYTIETGVLESFIRELNKFSGFSEVMMQDVIMRR